MKAFKLLTLATIITAAAFTASAQSALTVYTYSGFASKWGPGPKLKAAFEKTCACTVTFIGMEDGVGVLTRLRLEGKDSPADVAVGLDQNLTSEAGATGLFAPHGQSIDALTLPVAWKDANFLPIDHGAFAVVYDSQKIATPPKSLKELIEGNHGQKIILQDPRTSTPGLGMLLWIKSVYGDGSEAAWGKFKGNILTTTKGWSDAYGLFTKGEAPMVLSYTTSPAYHLIEEKSDRYKAAIFSDGHYAQIEVAGRLKASKNEALATQFLAFLITPEAQSILPTTQWMYPVRDLGNELPEAFRTLPKPDKTLMLDSTEIAGKRKVWTDEWLRAMAK
ncbi:thiamine ABC transporter substrate binding subunit [Lacibacterium aquatile]|uniref:Thiamine-binding periplasmic protein n=1 Tax=Lacibacterium aquatile TaxID=1168082 RepID=A0ABW5DNC6_9PROT